MPKTTKVSGSSTPSEVATAYKGSINPHDQKRLIALQMAQQGVWVLAEIGKEVLPQKLYIFDLCLLCSHGQRSPVFYLPISAPSRPMTYF